MPARPPDPSPDPSPWYAGPLPGGRRRRVLARSGSGRNGRSTALDLSTTDLLRSRVPSGSDGAPAADPGDPWSDRGGDGPRPSRPPGPGVKPAALVLGLAVVLFVGGSIALGLGGSTAPQSAPTSVRTAHGSPLQAAAGANALKPIEIDGQPPADIVDALAVPVASTVVSGSAQNLGVETYDHSLLLSVGASQAHVVTFFRDELKADGWQQVSSSPTTDGSGIEVLGQHSGSDGNTWEVGVVVHPTTFGSSGSAATVGTTTFSVELYIENTDD